MNSVMKSDVSYSPAELLKSYIEWGADETISEEPINWFSKTDNIQIKQNSAAKTSSNTSSKSKPVSQTPLASQQEHIDMAKKLAANCKNLDELSAVILEFEGCSLKKTASNTVFSDGNVKSDIMIIGEAPGGDEDRVGKPFVGEAGQLLDRMFAAIDMKRENDFYIANLLPWRPPGNRKPTDGECELCFPFIRRHIELFEPKLIISVGGTSASTLLNTKSGITKLRGKWQEYIMSGTTVPIIPIFHPDYLLRQPQFKKHTWHDLLAIKAKIGELNID